MRFITLGRYSQRSTMKQILEIQVPTGGYGYSKEKQRQFMLRVTTESRQSYDDPRARRNKGQWLMNSQGGWMVLFSLEVLL